MFKYQALFFAVVLMCCAFGANANGGESDKCYDEDKKVHYDKGQSYQPEGECSQQTCEGNNGWSKKICPALAPSPNCKPVPGDVTKPYPECCPSFTCS